MLEIIFTVLTAAALFVGIFFAATGVIGILRFPDYFARAQAATCISTMGTLGAVLAGIFYALGNGLDAVWYVKLILIALMIMISASVSGHSLSKGTYKRGHRPHFGGFAKDDYKEDGFDEL
ncbi:MAG: monovalent cation/H(+) antiporter subunit G [Clostridia bacterium]|nr:monovalent cation/H(+) antiporter subunit G [Clostridia bacterium]